MTGRLLYVAHPVAGDSDPAARARGLEHDCNVVKRCDGLVLVGGRMSSGMAIERGAAESHGRDVVDLTHLGDEPPAGGAR